MEATALAHNKRRPLIGGRYALLHELASGGMATVYVGRARGAAGFGRLVAIKCCHKHLRTDEDFARMFLDEARLVAELRHPNVISTLDFGEDDELSLYIVMEFVDGYSLLQVQRAARAKGQKIPAPIALRIVIDALQGLQAAHQHTDPKGAPLHIVHRDVSPQNILVGVDGVARIMDFGIARAESRLSHTRDGNIKGKAAYMAPEQHGLLMDNPPPLTHRADLFAMGVVLWELLTDKRLFQRENDAQTLAAAIRNEVVPASELVPSLPAAIDHVVATALQSDPDKRFASGDAFIEAIERCGLQPATTREAGLWVREVLAAQIAKRQGVLRGFAEDTTDEAEQAVDRALTSATNAKIREEIEATGKVPALAAGDVTELEVNSLVPDAPARQTVRRRLVPWLVAGALAAMLVGASFAWLGARQHRDAPAIAPAIAHREPPPFVPPRGPDTVAERDPSALAGEPRSAVDDSSDAGAASARPEAHSPAPARPVGEPTVPAAAAQRRRQRVFRPTFL